MKCFSLPGLVIACAAIAILAMAPAAGLAADPNGGCSCASAQTTYRPPYRPSQYTVQYALPRAPVQLPTGIGGCGPVGCGPCAVPTAPCVPCQTVYRPVPVTVYRPVPVTVYRPVPVTVYRPVPVTVYRPFGSWLGLSPLVPYTTYRMGSTYSYPVRSYPVSRPGCSSCAQGMVTTISSPTIISESPGFPSQTPLTPTYRESMKPIEEAPKEVDPKNTAPIPDPNMSSPQGPEMIGPSNGAGEGRAASRQVLAVVYRPAVSNPPRRLDDKGPPNTGEWRAWHE